MHRQIVAEAKRQGKSLNAYVTEKLQSGPKHSAVD
jgi:predicted HicB family RNase H-like nuclease